MDDFFDVFDQAGSPLHIMDDTEFFEKTQKLMHRISEAQHKSFFKRMVKESELPDESICNACKGCGNIISESGKTLDCHVDNEEGECYTSDYDAENFSDEMEALMDDVYELMSVDKLDNKS